MTLEDLQRLDITPFDGGVMADGMDDCITEREDRAQFAVMLRYLDLLARRTGIGIEIPVMNTCLKRGYRDYGPYSGFRKSKMEIMRRLYDNIILGTGWSYGVCKIDNDSAAGMEPELSENCSVHDWEKAVSMVPEVLALKQKGFRDIAITVCWSARIARYCEYEASNSREVEGIFGEAAAMVRRILHKMADPYAVGSRIQCCRDNCYVMAYYEGRSDEVTISPQDMDYNFFVQGMVLHLLLARAEELFGLTGHVGGGIDRGKARL